MSIIKYYNGLKNDKIGTQVIKIITKKKKKKINTITETN